MSLNASELAQFHEQGYLVKPGVFSASDLLPIKAAIAEMVDFQLRQLQTAGKLREPHASAPMETRLGLVYAQEPAAAEAVIRAIQGKGGGGYNGPAMFDMLRHPALLSCIESLIGPEIIGSSVYRIRPKLPFLPRGAVPWHQDSGYLLSHCDRHTIITCWIPLVDANEENGCLFVLPRAHHGGILRHFTKGPGGFLVIDESDLPAEQRPVPVPMAAGGVLFMTNLTPHCSYENASQHIRWSLDLRYQAADTPNNVGEDPATYVPERDPVTMACYPAEADFVLRSPAHPEREIRTPAAFEAVRERYEKARVHFPARGWTTWPKAQ